MTDIFDQASEREAKFRQAAITAARHCESLAHTGKCHNCDDPLEAGAFCDENCRDDYQARKDAEKRNGGG